ncbi:membrane protein [Marinomonas ushuaiensis DSM 15871]|uniref:Membrane protein n=1 Tax=Marinomonas ushuaiensis DSM 15871 TaxID=1122207 RepID=X7E4I8_9GAMM|nr:AEC family transporter [Marinomonas ushuaiensis]ETX10086.1 membrane protein [Marinomonas ushuaiensis DSM 15871]
MLNQVVSILFPILGLTFAGLCVGLWIKPDFRPINRVNMDVFVPALTFSSLVIMPLDAGQIPLLSAALLAVFIPALLMFPICYFFKLKYKVWAPPQMFRNAGNLAIPLFTYSFGDTAIAPAVLLFVVSSCLHFSIGLAIISKGNPFKQIIRMPIFLAAASALTLNLMGVGIWEPLYNATSLLGQAAIPIMLVSLGAQMCNMRLSGMRTGLLCTGLSLLTGAIAFTFIYLFIPLSTLHLQMMLLFTMFPPAVLNYMFAEHFDLEPEKVASMVLFSNFLCIVTLPIMLAVALSFS